MVMVFALLFSRRDWHEKPCPCRSSVAIEGKPQDMGVKPQRATLTSSSNATARPRTVQECKRSCHPHQISAVQCTPASHLTKCRKLQLRRIANQVFRKMPARNGTPRKVLTEVFRDLHRCTLQKSSRRPKTAAIFKTRQQSDFDSELQNAVFFKIFSCSDSVR